MEIFWEKNLTFLGFAVRIKKRQKKFFATKRGRIHVNNNGCVKAQPRKIFLDEFWVQGFFQTEFSPNFWDFLASGIFSVKFLAL